MTQPRHSTRNALVFLGVLVFAMFFDLLGGDALVVGNVQTDLKSQFLAWRQFGFGELAHGNFPLWNPHIYAGAPYFGGFQAALLYPPNILFLLLPLAMAINWSIALHVFLLGAFTFLWVKRRGQHPAAAALAGAIAMFCGAHFPHVYAGHLTNLCAMVWAPLILLAIDGILDGPGEGAASGYAAGGWCLLGMLALAMQILAGHPQYVFYMGIAAGIYALLLFLVRLRYPGHSRRTLFQLVYLAAIPIGGALLTSVQWLTGIQATGETLRSQALPFEFAAMFSFPPENLLTLVAPNVFGGLAPESYFGRCYLWEMSLFVGVTAVALAVIAIVPTSTPPTTDARGGKSRRQPTDQESAALRNQEPGGVTPLLIMLGILLLLALGVHTPLFRLLYTFVPGFDKFRGNSKFIFPAALFLALLAGIGFDKLLRTRSVSKSVIVTLLAAAGTCGLAALTIRSIDWLPVLRALAETNETYRIRPEHFAVAAFAPELRVLAERARESASNALFLVAGTALVLGVLLVWLRSDKRMVWAVGALALVELFVFARGARDTFDSTTVVPAELQAFVAQNPGEHRLLNCLNPNSALLTGALEMNGNDPGVVRRYAEFVAAAEGRNPNQATQYLKFASVSPLYSLLRLRWVLAPDGHKLNVLDVPTPPLPHVALVARARVIENRDAILAAMRAPSFDPRREAILERQPVPRPSGREAGGSARLVASSTDWLEIEADTPEPAILLITDLYTPAWRATPLGGSVQPRYELVPADYILRGVPLEAGHHHLRIAYRPRAFVIGTWISILATPGYFATLTQWWSRRPR